MQMQHPPVDPEALDDYCLQGSLAALIDVMDTYTDPSSIRSALDIIGACSRTTHKSTLYECMIKKKGLAKLVRIVESKPDIGCKVSALKALCSHISNNKEYQAEVNYYGGVQILTELLTLKYFELLPYSLPTLLSCLDNNEQNKKAFSTNCGISNIFQLLEYSIIHSASVGQIIERLVEITVLCANLPSNINLFWSSVSFSKTSIYLCLISSTSSCTRILQHYLKKESEALNLLQKYKGVELAISLMSTTNYCLSKAAFSALCDWLKCPDNHQALLIPSTFSLIVEHLNCEVNPLAQLSCARIVADCIAEFEGFRTYISLCAGHLFKQLHSIISSDVGRAATVHLLQTYSKSYEEDQKQKLLSLNAKPDKPPEPIKRVEEKGRAGKKDTLLSPKPHSSPSSGSSTDEERVAADGVLRITRIEKLLVDLAPVNSNPMIMTNLRIVKNKLGNVKRLLTTYNSPQPSELPLVPPPPRSSTIKPRNPQLQPIKKKSVFSDTATSKTTDNLETSSNTINNTSINASTTINNNNSSNTNVTTNTIRKKDRKEKEKEKDKDKDSDGSDDDDSDFDAASALRRKRKPQNARRIQTTTKKTKKKRDENKRSPPPSPLSPKSPSTSPPVTFSSKPKRWQQDLAQQYERFVKKSNTSKVEKKNNQSENRDMRIIIKTKKEKKDEIMQAFKQTWLKPVKEWNVNDIAVWLNRIGLAHYERVFRQQEITGELLLLFDKETETPFLHSDEDRIRLLEEVAKLHISKASADNSEAEDSNVYDEIMDYGFISSSAPA